MPTAPCSDNQLLEFCIAAAGDAYRYDDFAFITNFKASLDILQLSGSATDYQLETVAIANVIGTGVFGEGDGSSTGELIGVLQSVSATSFTFSDSAAFQFV